MKKNLIIVIAVVAVLLVVLFFVLRSPGPDEFGDGTDPTGQERGQERFRDRFSFPFFGESEIPTDQVLNDYIEYSQYPPTSRPLRRDMVDLTEPDGRFETYMPAIPFPEPGQDISEMPVDESDHFFLLTADRYSVIGEGEITFTLRAGDRPTDSARPVPLRIREASIHSGRQVQQANRVMDVEFENQDDTNIYRVTLKPSETNLASYHGRVMLFVDFEVGSDRAQSAIPFEYYPENTIPASFTGQFREDVENGSLVVYAEVEVERAGFYNIDANLFDNSGEPVAYTRFKDDLTQGRHEVPLIFFGKVLRDSNARSPFQMRNLRGFRVLYGETPDRELIVPYQGSYETLRYNERDQFSDEEWQDPEREARIQFLQSEIERGVEQPVPMPAD